MVVVVVVIVIVIGVEGESEREMNGKRIWDRKIGKWECSEESKVESVELARVSVKFVGKWV